MKLMQCLKGIEDPLPTQVRTIYLSLSIVLCVVFFSGLFLYWIFGDNQTVFITWHWLMAAIWGIVVGFTVAWNLAMETVVRSAASDDVAAG